MQSYKTFLNGIRTAISSAVNKASQRFEKMHNDLAYISFYEAPIIDVFSTTLESRSEEYFPSPFYLQPDKEYIVTLGEKEYRNVGKPYDIGDGGVFISDNGTFTDWKYFLVASTNTCDGLIAVRGEENVGKLFAIQLVGEPEVKKEHLHNYANNLSDSLQKLADMVNAFLDSDDQTLDQLTEIIGYIKENRDLITAITNGKVNVSDIVDNLITADYSKPLSARQGKILKELIDKLESAISSANTTANNAQSIAVEARSTASNAWERAGNVDTIANEAKTVAENVHKYARTGDVYCTRVGAYKMSSVSENTFCIGPRFLVNQDSGAFFIYLVPYWNKAKSYSSVAFYDGDTVQEYPIANGTIVMPTYGYLEVYVRSMLNDDGTLNVSVEAYDLSTGVPVYVSPVEGESST